MVFVIILLALVSAAIMSRRLCIGSTASRIYGSLLGSLVMSVSATAFWCIRKLVGTPNTNLWRLIAVSFHALCFTFPLLFIGIYVILVYGRRRPKCRHAGVVPLLFSTVLLSGAVGLLISGIYALKIEPNWVQVTHTTIRTGKLKASAPPLRIVQLSDLHIDQWGYRENRTLGLVSRLKPDLILLTGDYTNFAARYPEVRRFMKGLHARYGVYAIHGNWNPAPDVDKCLEGTGVQVIEYKHELLQTDSGPIMLAGIPWFAWGDSSHVLSGVRLSDAFVILMSHMPEGADFAPSGVDLVLAGHTHGGQVRIPGIGPVITLSQVRRDRAAGLSKLPNGILLYVNRGIGMEGGGAPRIRFLCRPEVAVFTVRGTGK